ncbi:hypothetical protein [Bacillus sp. TL12]|nr:hypothetical protein [Bacillus sp. TL12]MCI0764727.1 hypothetical protein [Bacillus sp. TL12]
MHYSILGLPKESKESLTTPVKHRGLKLITAVDYVKSEIVWQAGRRTL